MKFAHLFAIAALCLPFSALAEYSYSYVEGGYRYSEFGDDEGDGFDLEVNFLLGDIFFVAANMDEVEYDNDLHLDRFGLGIGAHFNAFSNIDIYGIVSYEDLEFDIRGADDYDDKGWGAEIGARYQLDDTWEFKGAVDYATYEDDVNDLESMHFVATAVYNLNNNYALIGEYTGGELENGVSGNAVDENDFRIALRIQF